MELWRSSILADRIKRRLDKSSTYIRRLEQMVAQVEEVKQSLYVGMRETCWKVSKELAFRTVTKSVGQDTGTCG